MPNYRICVISISVYTKQMCLYTKYHEAILDIIIKILPFKTKLFTHTHIYIIRVCEGFTLKIK